MFLNTKRLTAALALLVAGAAAVFFTPAVRLPGHNQGYAPVQPIAFSHAKHAGALGINCQYCHFTAERSPHAGFPAVSTCLNCHRYLSVNHSAEIKKIYDAAGLDEDAQPDPQGKPHPIEWIKIHSLPAFVRFDHSRHVLAGASCQTCHGAVDTMDRVRQEKSLSMGFCVNCHRQADAHGINGKNVNASLDCSVCHH
jgi:hypothetical protein